MNDHKSTRKCVFTNNPADAKVVLSDDKHSWTKMVPCCKEYAKKLQSRPLSSAEISLIDLFYKSEMTKIKLETYEKQMEHIRSELANLEKDYLKDLNQNLNILYISETDFSKIEDVLENPPPISDKLKEAMEKNKEEEKKVEQDGVEEKEENGLW